MNLMWDWVQMAKGRGFAKFHAVQQINCLHSLFLGS